MIRLIWSFIMKWGWDYSRGRRNTISDAPHIWAEVPPPFPSIGDPIRFNITPANGGVVITVCTYDRFKDRSNETIHVIPEDTDYAKAIGDIVAMEILKS